MKALRKFVAGSLVAASAVFPAFGDSLPDASDWDGVLGAAKGQTVYWHAWAGEPRINDYIAWVGKRLKAEHGVELVHVKVSDTAEVVGRVIAEKTAGRDENGSVDLIWINGENFVSMKRQGLLAGPDWATKLPNYALVDVERKPTITVDFTEPVDGLESPWGMAQIVFYHDTAVTKDVPKTMPGLLTWAKANPGRFTYPQPPNFLGSAFLKQALHAFLADPAILQKPVDPATFEKDVEPLFTWLEDLHPHLWRSGRTFPQNSASVRQLLADGETDIAFTFNPGDPSSAIEDGELPETVRSFVMETGSLSNSHFVAIPYNASAKAGALVVANFLMSPEAQARKQDPMIWGDPTVLALDKLTEEGRAHFDALELGKATLTADQLGTTLPEPHASWMTNLEKAWAARFAAN